MAPKFHELGVRPHANTAGYTLHCKDVPPLDPAALLALPAHEPEIPRKLEELLKWTTDGERYKPAASDEQIMTRLRPHHIKLQLKRRKIIRQLRQKGACKAFLVPEHAKHRFRFIQHPKLANAETSKDEKVRFTPFYERHNAVLKGKYVIDLDWSAFFDQFELSDEVTPFFSFVVRDGTVYSMKVLPMGLKHSVGIAHTATLQLLNFGPESYVEAYIDNVRIVSDDPQAVIRDAAKLLMRCAQARVTVNEADIGPLRDAPSGDQCALATDIATALLKQAGPWLGEHYDYVTKTIQMCDKTRAKVQLCLEAKRPTFRTFAATAGILQYASRTLGLSLAPYYASRRAFSDVAWFLERCPDHWDKPLPPLCDAVTANLKRWRDDLLAAKPRVMHAPEYPDLVIIVDASDTGWGALSFDAHGRETFSAEQWSTADKRAFDTRVSTRAEPEGLYRACCAMVARHKHRAVHIMSDSSAATGAINKGSSGSYWMNYVCVKLQAAFPEVAIRVTHTPGNRNPADGVSRGEAEPSAADWSRAREIADAAKATLITGRRGATQEVGGSDVPT